MTRLQKAILEIVQKSKKHFSAKEIYALVQAEFPSVAMGTVYRNLNQFAEDNLIRRVSGIGSFDFYEANIRPHNHSICIECGQLNDIHIDGINDIIENQTGDKVQSIDLLVNVICSKCNLKKYKKNIK